MVRVLCTSIHMLEVLGRVFVFVRAVRVCDVGHESTGLFTYTFMRFNTNEYVIYLLVESMYTVLADCFLCLSSSSSSFFQPIECV